MIAIVIGGAGLLIWLYLLLGHGGFWRLAEHDRRFVPAGAAVPPGTRVVAVIPARDEADVVATALRSLFRQQFSGRLEIVLVDDESSDGTAEAARACAHEEGAQDRLTVLQGRPEQGWTGKLAAMDRGFAHVLSSGVSPDFVLFCDADIAFAPGLVERLVAGAAARGTVLSSLMVKLRCESLAERWFVPAFVFFFQMLYPFSRVNDPKNPVAAAAGGVMLVRPAALEEAGGLQQIRGALIDDCALGKLMKKQGPIWLGLTDDAFSLRPYPHLRDIEQMVTRSAYAQLRYSPWRLAGAVAGMVVVYLAPPILAFTAPEPAAYLALVAYFLMAQSYMPSLRFYGRNRLGAFALPAVAACYTWFTILSAWRYGRGRGGAWKGRYQAP